MTLLIIIILLVIFFGGGGYYGYRAGYYGNGGIGLIGLLLIIIVLWLLLGGHSFAAEDTRVSAGSLYKDVIEPYLLTTFAALVTVAVGCGVQVFQKYTHITLTSADNARIQQAANNAAGRILAAVEGPANNLSFNVGDPAIAREITRVESIIPDALNRQGLTKENIANMITGKIGQLQMSSSTPAPAAPGA